MPTNRPSQELVQTRVRALISRDGVNSVANFYGVTRRTVIRWQRGETNPQASSDARSIARRGRALTGSVSMGRDARGRFGVASTIYRPEGVRAYNIAVERQQRRAEIASQVASTPSMMADAESMNFEVDREAYIDFDRRLANLQEASDYDRLDDFYDYYGYEDDWDSWRSTYEQMAG